MISSEFLTELNAVLGNLEAEFSEAEKFTFKINNLEFSMPVGVSCDGHITPDVWINRQHQNDRTHEPGLAGMMIFLSRLLCAREVEFFDVGALFGYFSLLARRCFPDAEIHSIEANPSSFVALQSILQADQSEEKPYQSYNVLIGVENRRSSFAQFGYLFERFPKSDGSHLNQRQLLKDELARIRDNNGKILKIEEMTLQHFIARNSSATSQLVLKIDVEGHQSIILPPAHDYLVDRLAIILLEFDSEKKLKQFNTTNAKICEPFLDSGYQLYWLDHRELHHQAQQVFAADMHNWSDTNSLGILVPENFVAN